MKEFKEVFGNAVECKAQKTPEAFVEEKHGHENKEKEEENHGKKNKKNKKKRKKKKRRKKTKEKLEEKDIKANEDDDIIIRNFKKNLTEYSKNFLNIRKIAYFGE